MTKSEIKRMECLEKNEFNCEDIHCIFYKLCERDSIDAFKEEWENLKRKKQEELNAIKQLLGEE